MKVGLLVHQFPSPEHPYIRDWAIWLAGQGVDLTVLAEKTGAAPAGLRVVGLHGFGDALPGGLARAAFELPVRLHHTLPLWRALSGEPKTRTRVRKIYEYLPVLDRRFDILHFNSPQIAIRRFELGDLLGKHSIVSFRGQDIAFHADRYDGLLRRAGHFHFLSRHLLELARGRGYAGDRHTIISPLLDAAFHRPPQPGEAEPRPPGRYHVFTAARLTWAKGWEFALQAIALLVNAGLDVHYHVAAQGDYLDAFTFTAHQLGIADRVHLLGWLGSEGIRQWMWRADVYLLASVEEAFNNSVLHAQGCGLPVVCTDEGGLPENIENGTTGLLARRRDAWDIAAKVEALLKDTERRGHMSAAGPERVRERFAKERILPEFLRMYERVTAGCERRAAEAVPA